MDDVLWELQPATDAKHRLYKRYLDAWWAKLLQPKNGWLRPRVTYVDAFAGPGRYAGGEEGSPLFVLGRLLHHGRVDNMHLGRDRVHLIFIEADRHRYEHLIAQLVAAFGPLEALPVTVIVRHGEAGDLTLPLLTSSGAWGQPILAVFDSWGNVNVPLGVIERVARNRSSEVIVTFGPNWFSRRENEDPDELDIVFGGCEHWQPSNPAARPDERWRIWLETYRAALGRAGFPWQLQFMVMPATGTPLHLVYGTGHRHPQRVLKRAGSPSIPLVDDVHLTPPVRRRCHRAYPTIPAPSAAAQAIAPIIDRRQASSADRTLPPRSSDCACPWLGVRKSLRQSGPAAGRRRNGVRSSLATAQLLRPGGSFTCVWLPRFD